MSDFLFACIEEAKRAGLYSGIKYETNAPPLATLFTILDCESEDYSQAPVEASLLVTPTFHEENVHDEVRHSFADTPPWCIPDTQKPGEASRIENAPECLAQVRNLLRQEALFKETIAKLSSDFHRVRRNHGFELRLLQKSINHGSSKDSKESRKIADLSSSLIKVSTERDFLQKEIFRLEEKMLVMKQYLMECMNDRTTPGTTGSEVVVVGVRNVMKLTATQTPKIEIAIPEVYDAENIQEFDLREIAES